MIYNEYTYNETNTSEQFNSLQGGEAIGFVRDNNIITSYPHSAQHVTSIKWQYSKSGTICNVMMTYVPVHRCNWENF